MRTRRVLRHAGGAIGLLLVVATAATAQVGSVPAGQLQITGRDRPPAPRTGTAAVKGRVIDGVTGAGVPRARVQIQSGPTSPSILTDGTGAFALTNLPAGYVTLAVNKSAYMNARYPEAGRTMRAMSPPLRLRDGQILDHIVVPIFHGGAIAGRVVDANGDPLEFAQVTALRMPPPGRGGRPAQRMSAQSNDLGEYRLARLEPGTYVLQVTVRLTPSGSAQPEPQPLPTFYPNALAIDQAQPLTLERGQTVSGIDVTVAEGLPAVIVGTVTGPDGQPAANGYVNARAVTRDDRGGFDRGGFDNSGTGIRQDGTFRLTLPPGEYSIEARMSLPNTGGPVPPENELFGIARVSAAGGAEEAVSIVLGHGATVSGRVVFEGTTPAPQSPGQVHVPVFSQDGTCRTGQATIAPDWTFRVAGLSGTCYGPPMGMFGRWMLKAVMHGGDNLLDTGVTFEPGQQWRNVQVVLTDRRSELSVRVADENGQSTREYVAVVYPIDKSQWPQSVRTIVSMPPMDMMMGARPAPAMIGGRPSPAVIVPPPRREMFTGLRPGDYYVVAVDDMQPEDPSDPTVLDRLRSSAVRVTVSEGANAEVTLRRVKLADVLPR